MSLLFEEPEDLILVMQYAPKHTASARDDSPLLFDFPPEVNDQAGQYSVDLDAIRDPLPVVVAGIRRRLDR